MDNEQVKSRKEVLKKVIEHLTDKIGNPTTYRTANGNPYVNSLELQEDKKKLEEKLAEYNSLIESFVVANLVMQKTIIFSDDGMHTIKYVPQKNRFDFYIGNEYKSSNVTFSEDDETATVIVPTQNSDTHGEIINYIYNVKVAQTVNPVVKKAKPKPCSKIDEGLAMVNQDDAYYESMGFIKDPVYGKWRKQTPLEYEGKQKAIQNRPVIKRRLALFNR